MSALRNLAGQTAIYGLSSIGARFLNYLLVPLYTSKGVFEPAEYGVITSLYAWTAFLNVVLTFGMETTFFRFSSKDNYSVGGRLERRPSSPPHPMLCSSPLSSSWCWVLASRGTSPAGIGFPAHGSLRADAGDHHRHRCAHHHAHGAAASTGSGMALRGDQHPERGGERGAQPLHLPVLHEEVQRRREQRADRCRVRPVLRRGLCVPDQPDQHRREAADPAARVAAVQGLQQAAATHHVRLRCTADGRRPRRHGERDRRPHHPEVPAARRTSPTRRSGSTARATSWRC